MAKRSKNAPAPTAAPAAPAAPASAPNSTPRETRLARLARLIGFALAATNRHDGCPVDGGAALTTTDDRVAYAALLLEFDTSIGVYVRKTSRPAPARVVSVTPAGPDLD